MGRAPAHDRPPPYDQTLVVCRGGPRHGAWYFLDHGPSSWAERVRIARDFEHEDPARSATLSYVLTQGRRDHPRWERTGRVLQWNPLRAVELAEQEADSGSR